MNQCCAHQYSANAMSAVSDSIYENFGDANFSFSKQRSLPTVDMNANNHAQQLQLEQKMVSASGDPSSTVNASRGKHAAMEIYKPPSLRSGKLNVHAKEFIMNNRPAASNDTFKSEKPYPLNSSKSSGSVMLNLSKSNSSQLKSNGTEKFIPSLSSTNNQYDLQRAKSSGNVLLETHANAKVQFKVPSPDKMVPKPSPIKEKKSPPNFGPSQGNLKRSKSLSAADAMRFMALEASLSNCAVSFTEYHLLPAELRSLIKKAVENSDQATDKDKIILGRRVVENVLNDKKIAHAVAKVSVAIMDRDKSGAYLDSMMNTCQMLYQTKKSSTLADPTKFVSFLAFLQEIYSELKRSKTQLMMKFDSTTPPRIIFLGLIARCCEDILLMKDMHSLPEIECVFRALTSMGRDVELELPNLFARLFDVVREVLLQGKSGPEVQKTLLQLIELRAANWRLPISALNYYYAKTSNI